MYRSPKKRNFFNRVEVSRVVDVKIKRSPRLSSKRCNEVFNHVVNTIDVYRLLLVDVMNC